jgi:hypothetical protein
MRAQRAGYLSVGFAILLVVAMWVAGLQAAAPPSGLLVDFGHVDRFEPGTVTTLQLHDGRLREVTELPHGHVSRDGYHVVRLETGEVRVLSWRGPLTARAVWWMPDVVTYEPDGYFVDSGDGSRWYYDGSRAFGPAERNLDHYESEVTEAGRVLVDVTDVIRGGDPPPPPLRAARP